MPTELTIELAWETIKSPCGEIVGVWILVNGKRSDFFAAQWIPRNCQN